MYLIKWVDMISYILNHIIDLNTKYKITFPKEFFISCLKLIFDGSWLSQTLCLAKNILKFWKWWDELRFRIIYDTTFTTRICYKHAIKITRMQRMYVCFDGTFWRDCIFSCVLNANSIKYLVDSFHKMSILA